jgi:hypothetical protein
MTYPQTHSFHGPVRIVGGERSEGKMEVEMDGWGERG